MTNIDIQKIGTYISVDENGYLINDLSKDSIQKEWKPVVDRIVALCQEKLGEDLVSINVRGSVAKGKAVKNISDIDMFVIVKGDGDDINFDDERDAITSEFPFVNGIEFGLTDLDRFSKYKGTQMMIKTQSVLVYGEDLAKDIPPYTIKGMYGHVLYIKRDVESVLNFLGTEQEGEEIKKRCTWIMKRILRSGMEIVMERKQKYTRDLYLCYEAFSEFYPEQKDAMYQVLGYAINPISDTEEIGRMLGAIGTFMTEEGSVAKNTH